LDRPEQLNLSDEKPDQKPEKRERAVVQSIAAEIDLFVTQIDALAETLPMATLAIRGAIDSSRKHLNKFIEEECNPQREGGHRTYTVRPGRHLHHRRLIVRVQRTVLAHELVPRSLLVSLVSQYDAFLGRVIRQLFNLKPEILNSSGNTLTFAQFTAFGSVDDARDYVIDKEIEVVLRKSHTEQFEWLENKFGLSLRTDLDAWPVFIEVTERRNLFVHTNGVVSHQYIEVCKRNSCKIATDTCGGRTLLVTREYFEAAQECLFEIGVKLAQVLWRKVAPDDLVNADYSLIRVIYELIAEGRYRLARVLSDFGTEVLKKHGSEELRLVMVVNRAQAYKWSGDEDSCRRIVGAEDWSARSAKFRLAKAVLLDDFDKAIEIFREIGADDKEMNKDSYREWPLYRAIRGLSGFATAFEEIFGEPLNKVILPADEASNGSNGIVN